MRAFVLSLFLLVWCSAATCQGLQREKSKIEDLVDLWKTILNGGDLEVLKGLYASIVNFYGEKMTPEQCVRTIALQQSSQPALLLTIKSDIHYTTFKSGIVKCDFIKGVFSHNVQKELPAYLVLKKEKEGYKIIEESDKLTDRRLGATSDWGPQVPLDMFLADTLVDTKTSRFTPAWVLGVTGLLVLVVGSFLIFFRKKKTNTLQNQDSSAG